MLRRLDRQAVADPDGRPRRGRLGLDLLAGVSRGAVFSSIGTGDNAFNRIAREMTAYYLLSAEPEAGTATDAPTRSRSRWHGRGVTVRARRDFAVAVNRAGETLTPEQAVANVLGTPLLATELPLKVATYSMRVPGDTAAAARDLDRGGSRRDRSGCHGDRLHRHRCERQGDQQRVPRGDDDANSTWRAGAARDHQRHRDRARLLYAEAGGRGFPRPTRQRRAPLHRGPDARGINRSRRLGARRRPRPRSTRPCGSWPIRRSMVSHSMDISSCTAASTPNHPPSVDHRGRGFRDRPCARCAARRHHTGKGEGSFCRGGAASDRAPPSRRLRGARDRDVGRRDQPAPAAVYAGENRSCRRCVQNRPRETGGGVSRRADHDGPAPQPRAPERERDERRRRRARRPPRHPRSPAGNSPPSTL